MKYMNRSGYNDCAIVMNTRAAIKAITSYLPAGKLTNEQLAEQFGDWHASQILAKTGVAVRGIAAPDEWRFSGAAPRIADVFESFARHPPFQRRNLFADSRGLIFRDSGRPR